MLLSAATGKKRHHVAMLTPDLGNFLADFDHFAGETTVLIGAVLFPLWRSGAGSVEPANRLPAFRWRLALALCPLRHGRAPRRELVRINLLVHGIVHLFVSTPPPVGDIADDRLTAFANINVLDNNLLIAAVAMLPQGFHLGCEGPHQLVDDTLMQVQEIDPIRGDERSCVAERQHMNRRHLEGQHRLKVVSGLDAGDQSYGSIQLSNFRFLTAREGIGDL
ncbi:hypothetical protein [Agrobacterium pusense]|uniref:hypothetical protein n=1 Tax=Agrobacterium pusense TaxID=648995 RepID=UPI001F398E2C|nr:hypothetical protein [Agrobacterium pusense]